MIIVEVAGHLGNDPEVRFTSSGAKVTAFRVATTIKRGDKEKTLWWRVSCWGDRFDKRLAYLKKGSPVIAVGELGIPEIYTDKAGNQQISLDLTAEIISFSPFGKGAGKPETEEGAAATGPAGGYGSYGAAQGGQSPGYAACGSTQPGEGPGAFGPTAGAGQANFAQDDIPF